MHIILHIGTHKTGTSSIQQALYDSRHQLLNHGILYPESGRPLPPRAHTGHHLLGWGLRDKRGAGMSSWWALKDELSESDAHTVIISTEDLSPSTSEQIQRVRDFLAGHKVTVVLYLRSHESYAVSCYKEFVKGNRRFVGRMSDYLALRGSRLDYRGLVHRWRATFPDTRWVSFDEHKRDLIPSFASITGVPQSLLVPSVRRNVSPSDAAINLLRHINFIDARLPKPLSLSRLQRAVVKNRHVGRVLVRVLEAVGDRTICTEQDRDLIRRYATEPEQPYHDLTPTDVVR